MVSVIMNTVNEDRHFLDLAIESYLNQEGIEFELIISTVEGDKNIQYIKDKYPKCRIVTMPREEHPISKGGKSPLGSFLQLNNALQHMRGEWFTFASSNDFAYPWKLQLEVQRCIDTNSLVCYSAYNYVNSKGVKYKKCTFPQSYNYANHLKGNFVADCSMIHKSIVENFLPFKIEFKNYAYWDLWLRVYESIGNVFCYNPTPTWGYRQDENSMHVKRWKNPQQMKEAEKDRDFMLSFHR